MKLGVLINLYGGMPLKEALAKVKAMGIEAVEIGAGGYPGKAHCDRKHFWPTPTSWSNSRRPLTKAALNFLP